MRRDRARRLIEEQRVTYSAVMEEGTPLERFQGVSVWVSLSQAGAAAMRRKKSGSLSTAYGRNEERVRIGARIQKRQECKVRGESLVRCSAKRKETAESCEKRASGGPRRKLRMWAGDGPLPVVPVHQPSRPTQSDRDCDSDRQPPPGRSIERYRSKIGALIRGQNKTDLCYQCTSNKEYR
ncbi:hypothetical protein KM043_004755 [Ampulex compressa]|nr:hypothetical protein KM043_004755 [Ampulex compressa]